MATTTLIAPTPTYVDCGAITAGTLVALAISVVLIPFGESLGLSLSNYTTTADITTRSVIVIGLWTLWVQLMAAMAGGYLAGRILRTSAPNTPESELRDGAHGLVVWAASTVLMAIGVAIAGFWATFAAQNGADVQLPAETARKLHVISGFLLAATSVVSAAAAWAMATLAGDHRDSNIDVSRFVSFRRKIAKK